MKEKVKKLTKEELNTVIDLQTRINSVVTNIGFLEVQKQNLLHQVNSINQQVESHKTFLRQKYGNINIDINTGVYTEAKEEESKTKNPVSSKLEKVN